MSTAAFQAAIVRLVVDRRFRERVATAGERALPSALSARERRRLLAAAAHRGLDITRMMYVSFRLSRLQASAPHTFRMLGKRRLYGELSLYLERRRPTSFYYIDEGRALLAHLSGRVRSGALAIPYIADVIAYEAALLAMQDARNRGVDATVTIRVGHDLTAITKALDAGRRPRRIPAQAAIIIGQVQNGQIQFRLRSSPAVRKPAVRPSCGSSVACARTPSRVPPDCGWRAPSRLSVCRNSGGYAGRLRAVVNLLQFPTLESVHESGSTPETVLDLVL